MSLRFSAVAAFDDRGFKFSNVKTFIDISPGHFIDDSQESVWSLLTSDRQIRQRTLLHIRRRGVKRCNGETLQVASDRRSNFTVPYRRQETFIDLVHSTEMEWFFVCCHARIIEPANSHPFLKHKHFNC